MCGPPPCFSNIQEFYAASLPQEADRSMSHVARGFFKISCRSESSKYKLGHWVSGWEVFFQEILPLHGSILQAGTYQIFSFAENPRWSQVWQYFDIESVVMGVGWLVVCKVIFESNPLKVKVKLN